MARQAQLTVTLSAASTNTVSVNYATVNGTATAPDDYTPQTGTLTFSPGEVSKVISITIRDDLVGNAAEAFSVVLSTPTNATILDGTGIVNLGAGGLPEYYMRFNWIYDKLHDNTIGYFGPQTGPNAFAVPRHIPEVDPRIINEAPDYGGETVSETASFWVGLEAWKGLISEDWTGYINCANKIEQFYIPNAANQPIGTYNPAKPADYVPEGEHVEDYPRLADITAVVGSDPLAAELESTYGNKRMYLMHWIIDVEGAYNFKNAEGTTNQIAFMNTYQRGMQESSYDTIPQGAWNNWENGGRIGNGGYEPLFNQSTPDYPAAPFPYAKKWSYTNAPDAEVRAIQWAFWAKEFATEQGKTAQISASNAKYIKMGDYTRYNLFDKYFRTIGNNQVAGSGDACHYLINWYASWGGEIPETGLGSWSYRIGCGESHQGYQGLIAAYAMATGGGGMVPQSPSAGDMWLTSVYRQIEMIRWLQTPEGPIAGGVTNSYAGDYRVPDGGRELAKFYGMSYVYSPVWHDPLSNNWVGFQGWGQGRTADLFLVVSDKTTPLAVAIRPNLEIILDRLVSWIIRESTITYTNNVATDFSLPGNLSWIASPGASGPGIPTTDNFEGTREYIPTLNWDSSGDYAAFWDYSTVPNPHLHCAVDAYAHDLGVGASFAYLLIAYAKAKRNMNKFTTNVDISVGVDSYTHTAEDAFKLAKDIIDAIWSSYRSNYGISVAEPRSDYAKMLIDVYVPPTYTGTMPNGDPINQSSTFVSIRSFLQDDPAWPSCLAYATAVKNNPAQTSVSPPNLIYHRFWAQAEYAMSCAALQKHFSDLV